MHVHRSKSGQQDEVILSFNRSVLPQESIFPSLEVTLLLRVHALITPSQLSQFLPDILYYYNHRILESNASLQYG
jgi:hypothetical protein